MSRSRIGWMVLWAGLLAAGCEQDAGGGRDAHPESYPYQVVATVGMISDTVTQVAGEVAEVKGLIGSGVDPHLYKPTRSDVVALQGADIIFYCGLMLEGKMADTLERVARNKPVFAVTEQIDSQYLIIPEGMEGHPDPHVWMDPSAWARCAEAVGRRLREYDPPNAERYTANAVAFMKQCQALFDYGQKTMATIPPDSRVLITSHDAFNYFGRAFNLEVMGIQGISTESEAGLQDINSLVDLIVDRNIRAVFVESSVPAKNVQALIDGAGSRGHQVRIGGELFSDAMGAAGTYEGTYIGMIDHNITTVVRALGGQAPEGGMQGKLKP